MTETKSFAETIKSHGNAVNGSLVNLIKGLLYKQKELEFEARLEKKWKTMYISLIGALWHLKPFRLHFAYGKKKNIFGSPSNCLIAAIENAFLKYHGHMEKLVSLEEKTSSLYYMQFPEKHQSEYRAATEAFLCFLLDEDFQRDLSHIHTNLRHFNTTEMEPDAVFAQHIQNRFPAALQFQSLL